MFARYVARIACSAFFDKAGDIACVVACSALYRGALRLVLAGRGRVTGDVPGSSGRGSARECRLVIGSHPGLGTGTAVRAHPVTGTGTPVRADTIARARTTAGTDPGAGTGTATCAVVGVVDVRGAEEPLPAVITHPVRRADAELDVRHPGDPLHAV